ncbi:Os10g0393350 [Oryza sativa Japonica Group]|uniref:Os10g0393350 protein n=1 Tax=Oryza sativa subsp. japonica TaxID=39947 RepID=A0A0P0XU82_ORYSJ|nr:Os10g0393350 [Oryza sativa Japonica Group]
MPGPGVADQLLHSGQGQLPEFRRHGPVSTTATPPCFAVVGGQMPLHRLDLLRRPSCQEANTGRRPIVGSPIGWPWPLARQRRSSGTCLCRRTSRLRLAPSPATTADRFLLPAAPVATWRALLAAPPPCRSSRCLVRPPIRRPVPLPRRAYCRPEPCPPLLAQPGS